MKARGGWLLLSLLVLAGTGSSARAGMFLDFEGGSRLEDGFTNWNYVPGNPSDAGSRSEFNSDPVGGHVRSFYAYYNGANNNHIGWLRYGYSDIDENCVAGGGSRCYKFLFTGGAYDNAGAVATTGLEVRSKERHQSLIDGGQNPLADRPLEGDVQLYTLTSQTSNTTPLPEAQGADRLGLWVLLPPGGEPDRVGAPDTSVEWYPFPDRATGGHYYHYTANIGLGGWTRIVFDAHPVHHNSNSFNFPTYRAYRRGGLDAHSPGDPEGYFSGIMKFALRIGSFQLTSYPTSIYLDQVDFYHSSQPENDETISSLGVGYDPADKYFDISFCDKYICNGGPCEALYDVRYSFDPLTNANHDAAKPVRVISFPNERFNFTMRNRFWTEIDGQVRKNVEGYNQIWALMRLQPEDEPLLTEGRTIYFSVKDISNRDYAGNANYDPDDITPVPVPGVGNIPRIRLVKTLAYTLYPTPGGSPVSPAPVFRPRRLRVR
jgi:hypothetical protein